MIYYKIPSSACLMIGDAQADIDAAKDNNIDFIFRKHQDNTNIPIKSNIKTIDNFLFKR